MHLYLKNNSVQTVCANSGCPNIGECYSEGNVSFLILGNICTRRCLFCAIRKGEPREINPDEPKAVRDAVYKLKLKYAVITSVSRDDLADGGSGHYASVVKAIKNISKETIIETLVPDFKGSKKAIERIMDAGAAVLSHNLEVVEKLHRRIRPDFDYRRSLGVLEHASSYSKATVKSGFMVGLGETDDEIERLMRDIKNSGCSYLTIGQYLRPRGSALEVKEYVEPGKFSLLKEKALELGFKKVASGPFVRSSYRAGDFFNTDCDEKSNSTEIGRGH